MMPPLSVLLEHPARDVRSLQSPRIRARHARAALAVTAHYRLAPGFRSADGRVDRQFLAILDAYRDYGGLARVQELLGLFRQRAGPDLSTIARWIVKREVISFEWQSQTWFPLFQFDRMSFQIKELLRPVLTELALEFDGWELAVWFTQPNGFLADRMPLQVLPGDPDAVFFAARADRFIANG